jgi:hypothetical protein
MSTFYEVARDPLIKKKVAAILNSTLNQEAVQVNVLELLSSPRSVLLKGVTNPTGAIMKKLKDGMLSRCDSDIFR